MPQPETKDASPAFSILVKRLQESLSRMEEFEVVVAAQNANDGKLSFSSRLNASLIDPLPYSRLSTKRHDYAWTTTQATTRR